MPKLLYEQETYAIRGAIFEVYKTMGSGFLEGVYQECLAREFRLRGIPFVEQTILTIVYKSYPLNQIYKTDFICYKGIILELKAVKELLDDHRAQIFNYLKASNLKIDLLANFGHYPQVQIERFIL